MNVCGLHQLCIIVRYFCPRDAFPAFVGRRLTRFKFVPFLQLYVKYMGNFLADISHFPEL